MQNLEEKLSLVFLGFVTGYCAYTVSAFQCNARGHAPDLLTRELLNTSASFFLTC